MTVWIHRPQEKAFDQWLAEPEAAYWRLEGEGGSGKTSLLNRFWRQVKAEDKPVILMPANECVSQGDRDGTTILINLDIVNAPEFERVRGILTGAKNTLQVVLEASGEQALANWDLVTRLAECQLEGAGEWAKGVRDVAKIWKTVRGSANDAERTAILAMPEEALLKALAKDMKKAGVVWLVDTWEQADAQPFETRLDFPAPGRLRTPPRAHARQTRLLDWLDGIAAWLFEQQGPCLVMAAGREAPAELGKRPPPLRGPVGRTQPLTAGEIGEYLREALPELDHAAAPLADLHRLSRGNLLLVDWIARLIAEEAWETGNWNWARWGDLVESFTADERYGLVHYAMDRIVQRAAGIADIWKVVLVRELTPEVVDILFPPAGREGPTGRALLRELERLGVAHRPRRGGERWLIHDVTREALEYYARYHGLLDPARNRDLHRQLAEYYDRLSGWTDAVEAESAAFHSLHSIGSGKVFAPSSLSLDSYKFILESAFHHVLLSLAENPSIRASSRDELDVMELAKRLCATVNLTAPEVRFLAVEILKKCDIERLADLVEILRREKSLEGGYSAEDIEIFHRIYSASGEEDLAGLDVRSLMEKYREAPAALTALAASKALPLHVREDCYRQAVAADPRDANTLGDFALFLHNVRGSYDAAAAMYRQAVSADPRHANNLGNFALFLKNVRGSYDAAEAMYRQAVSADPRHARHLGNFALFLQKVRGSYDEAEAMYRQAVSADPRHANNLGNFAGFLLSVDRVEEGEAVWRQALALADRELPFLALELWFYAYAHFPDRREAALREVVARLEQGVRSPGFDLSAHAEAARRQGHPDPERVAELARTIAEKP